MSPEHPINRRDFLKLTCAGIAVLALRQCEAIGIKIPSPEGTKTDPTQTIPSTEAPTPFVEPGRILDPDKDAGLLTPEIKTRFEEFDSLHPELEGREVYKFAVQFPSGPIGFVTHDLKPEEIQTAIIARSKDGKTILSVPDRALYATVRDTQTNQYTWNRLLGIATPGEGEDTKIVTWYYLAEGYPKPDEATPLDLDSPILNYQMPQNGVIFFWEPAISGGKSIWGNNPDAALAASYNTLPEKAQKVLFRLMPVVESAPEGAEYLPAGIVAVRNPDGTWGVGIDEGGQTKAIAGISVDANGFHFTTDGGIIDITVAEMAKRLKAGQASPLQIYNEAQSAILYAYDTENKAWVDASKVLQLDRTNPENYIRIQTWDDIKELARLEKMVLLPFPPDTYFPPLDKIFTKYYTMQGSDPKSDFNFNHPFGILEDLSKSPFRFVNFILLEKGEGREFDTYIVTEQVYNPAAGTFSVLHFGFDEFEPGWGLGTMQMRIDPPGNYLLPAYAEFSSALIHREKCYTICNELDFFEENHYFDANGEIPAIKSAVEAWLTTGVLSDELENLIHITRQKSFTR